MLERDVLRQCKDYLKWKGWKVMRFVAGPLTEEGLPDLVILRDGITIYLEIKSTNGELSKFQKEMRKDIQDHKGCYLWVNSLDQLMGLLEY